jgi:hypothetical protein
MRSRSLPTGLVFAGLPFSGLGRTGPLENLHAPSAIPCDRWGHAANPSWSVRQWPSLHRRSCTR